MDWIIRFILKGVGLLSASLPVQKTPFAGTRGRWANRGVTPVSSDRSRRVMLCNSSDMPN